MKEYKCLSSILEEFELFAADCTASLFSNKEHQEVLDDCLLLFCFIFLLM